MLTPLGIRILAACIFIFKTAKTVAGCLLFILYTTINCGVGAIYHYTMIYHGAYTIEN